MPDNPALRNAARLGIFAIVAALLLGVTYAGTRDRIALAQAQLEQEALAQVVAGVPHRELALDDKIDIPRDYHALLNTSDGDKIQVVRNEDGDPVAFIVPTVAPDGYSGDIRIIVGITLNGVVSGLRVVEHSETPGLGDRVEVAKSDWVFSFNGRQLDPAVSWNVTKDGGEFDSFTGATITPRAVVRQARLALVFFNEFRDSAMLQAEDYES